MQYRKVATCARSIEVMRRCRMHTTVKLTLGSAVAIILVVFFNIDKYGDRALIQNSAILQDTGTYHNWDKPPDQFDYLQYQKARLRLNKHSNLYVNLRSHKMNTNSTYSPEDHEFKVTVGKVTEYGVFIHIKVMEKSGQAVPGCSFRSRQYYGQNFRFMAMCKTISYQQDTHIVFCLNHGTECTHIEINFRFSRYEQYQDEPRILPWDYPIYRDKLCRSAYTKPSKLSQTNSVSWRVGAGNQCEHLLVNNIPVIKMDADDSCECVRRYDDIYLIGTSHIRYFSDFLLKKCWGQNFSGIAANHKDLELGNVHYLAWTFIEEFHFQIQVQLPLWLDPDFKNMTKTATPKPGTRPRSIAIWIQTGSWDFSKISYNFTMEHAIPLLEDALWFLRRETSPASTKTRVDLRVISTTPMTDKWYWNNYAIGAYNAAERDMVGRLGIDFTDILSMEMPCKDSLEGNHYFYRENETFAGVVGENVYFGHFLPKVCGHRN